MRPRLSDAEETVKVEVRMGADLKRQIEQMAADDGEDAGVSAWIRKLVRAEVQRRQATPAAKKRGKGT